MTETSVKMFRSIRSIVKQRETRHRPILPAMRAVRNRKKRILPAAVNPNRKNRKKRRSVNAKSRTRGNVRVNAKSRVRRDARVNAGGRVRRDARVSAENRGLRDVRASAENRDRREPEESRDLLGVRGNAENRGRRESQVRRDRRGQPDRRDQEGNPDRADRRDLAAIRRTARLRRFSGGIFFCRKAPVFRLKRIYRMLHKIYLCAMTIPWRLRPGIMRFIIIYPRK